MSCKHCIDPAGEPCYPSYGVAPHTCFYKIPGAAIGQSTLLPRDQWPDNFVEDPESPGHGIYWCAHCGHGKPADQTERGPHVPPATAGNDIGAVAGGITQSAPGDAVYSYECRQPGDNPDLWREFFDREKPAASASIRNVRRYDGSPDGADVPAEFSLAAEDIDTPDFRRLLQKYDRAEFGHEKTLCRDEIYKFIRTWAARPESAADASHNSGRPARLESGVPNHLGDAQ